MTANLLLLLTAAIWGFGSLPRLGMNFSILCLYRCPFFARRAEFTASNLYLQRRQQQSQQLASSGYLAASCVLGTILLSRLILPQRAVHRLYARALLPVCT